VVVLERSDVFTVTTKENAIKKHFTHLRKILKAKLRGQSAMTAISACIVPTVMRITLKAARWD